MELDLKKFIISILLVGIFMSIDLWTKYEITNSKVLHEISWGPDDFITIRKPVINYGATGIFSSSKPNQSFRYWHIFVAVIAAVCFILMVLNNYCLWHSVLAAIPVGGMWGNVFEMLTFGGVTDFLQSKGLGTFDNFIFNVADVLIYIGIPLYIITLSSDFISKFISLAVCVSIIGLTHGKIPSEPITFILIGGLCLLDFWPAREGVRV